MIVDGRAPFSWHASESVKVAVSEGTISKKNSSRNLWSKIRQDVSELQRKTRVSYIKGLDSEEKLFDEQSSRTEAELVSSLVEWKVNLGSVTVFSVNWIEGVGLT